MAKPMKTPGVYIVEKNAFPNSIVEVETSVPVFIGYTERASYQGSSLAGKPTMLTSLNEYHDYFGAGPQTTFVISAAPVPKAGKDAKTAPPPANEATVDEDPSVAQVTYGGNTYSMKPADKEEYYLYTCMQMFFANGGGKCFVVSVGDYSKGVAKDDLVEGIEPLIKEQEPTMLVIPDAVLLNEGDCKAVQESMLAHCAKMANRISILDVRNGYKDFTKPDKTDGDVIEKFRSVTGVMKYGAAYYPWLRTSVISDRELGVQHLRDELTSVTKKKLVALLTADLTDTLGKTDKKDAQGKVVLDTKTNLPVQEDVVLQPTYQSLLKSVGEIAHTAEQLRGLSPDAQAKLDALNDALRTLSPVYKFLIREIKDKLNLLPPAAAMAGIYTRVDTQRGVWKAPANVGVAWADAPSVSISHDGQETLNVHPMGKSVNAIREFINEGVMVWGARTLDGNSLDWRYISVRRTMIMLEESVRLAAKAYVFEPNTANTWVTMKSMIANFLTGIWKRGGLAGAVPEDAFSVHVGLGETMTAVDILEGILRITVLVAPTRPAEFIEITFQQQQQKS